MFICVKSMCITCVNVQEETSVVFTATGATGNYMLYDMGAEN